MSFTSNWTPEEDDILRDLYQKGISTIQIARQLGRSKNSIIGRSHRLKGLEPRPSPIRPAAIKPERITHNTLPPLASLSKPVPTVLTTTPLAERMRVTKLLMDGKSNESVSAETKLSLHTVREIRKTLALPKRSVKKGDELPKVFAAASMEFRHRSVPLEVRYIVPKFGERFQFGRQLKHSDIKLPTADDIAAHIAKHGVTRLPTAAAAVTTATIAAQDQVEIAAYRAARDAEHYAKYAPRNKRASEASSRAAAMRR